MRHIYHAPIGSIVKGLGCRGASYRYNIRIQLSDNWIIWEVFDDQLKTMLEIAANHGYLGDAQPIAGLPPEYELLRIEAI